MKSNAALIAQLEDLIKDRRASFENRLSVLNGSVSVAHELEWSWGLFHDAAMEKVYKLILDWAKRQEAEICSESLIAFVHSKLVDSAELLNMHGSSPTLQLTRAAEVNAWARIISRGTAYQLTGHTITRIPIDE